jgi:tRNA U34 5-carboxymethylaminomethyl modifying GTPase MnmE/TrmE
MRGEVGAAGSEWWLWVQALQQTSGVQRKQYEAWRKSLLRCLAHVEAVIDFGDDNDIQSGVAREILPLATALRKVLVGILMVGQPPPPPARPPPPCT